jgi:hypothetical protein
MEMKPESILALFAGCDAQQRASFTSQVIEGLDSGYADPIKIISAVKNMQAILDDIEKFAKPLVLDELDKCGGKLELHGLSLQKKEAGVKYDYSCTNDQVYNYLSADMELLKNKIKEREAFLKTLPVDGQAVLDEETGEAYKILRPIKTSTTTYMASLK